MQNPYRTPELDEELPRRKRHPKQVSVMVGLLVSGAVFLLLILAGAILSMVVSIVGS